MILKKGIKKDMKKKILYVHHAGGFGGAPKSMSYIIKFLDKDKYEPTLVNITKGPINEFFKGFIDNVILVDGIRPFHGSTVVEKSFKLLLRNWIFLVPSIFLSFRLIKKLKPEIIHLNSTCLFAFAIAGKLARIKVICHVREPIRKGVLWGGALRFFCRKFVDGFIAICEYDLSSLKLKKNNQKTKSIVCYNFVEQINSGIVKNESLKKELKLNDESIIFIYLARFAKSNGWLELIDMARSVVVENVNFHFVLIGADKKEHLEIKVDDNIHILPFRQDVIKSLEGADVFVCPFTEPHFARGVIEASALGLPIISSNIGGVQELVKEGATGLFYNNQSEFTNCCDTLGNSLELRNEMGLEGIKLAQEKFSMECNLEKTYEFYNQF